MFVHVALHVASRMCAVVVSAQAGSSVASIHAVRLHYLFASAEALHRMLSTDTLSIDLHTASSAEVIGRCNLRMERFASSRAVAQVRICSAAAHAVTASFPGVSLLQWLQ